VPTSVPIGLRCGTGSQTAARYCVGPESEQEAETYPNAPLTKTCCTRSTAGFESLDAVPKLVVLCLERSQALDDHRLHASEIKRLESLAIDAHPLRDHFLYLLCDKASLWADMIPMFRWILPFEGHSTKLQEAVERSCKRLDIFLQADIRVVRERRAT